jgi:hypothetical protein
MKRLDGRFRVSDTSSRPSSTTENLERSPIQGRSCRLEMRSRAWLVPEPNTVALLLAGLTGLAWGGRRR